LTGDSAGGNLIASLTLLCIMSQVRIPDGCLMIYPCLCIDTNIFTPRLLLSLNDKLLPYTFLKICCE